MLIFRKVRILWLIIGEEVFASESSYADLLGGIKEIRTGDDRKIENEGPDIFCAFREPI